MKVVLLENLLISGKRYTAGEEIEVDDTVGLQLLKENRRSSIADAGSCFCSDSRSRR